MLFSKNGLGFPRVVLAFTAALLISTHAIAGLTITSVTADRPVLAAVGEKVRISFQLSDPATFTTTIYNSYNEAIRTLSSNQVLASGDQSVVWDGRDNHGRVVPPEAYVFTISAFNDAETVVYDVADVTGGETVNVTDITYDAASGELSYAVPKPSRVFLRVGIANGFVLKTLLNNEVQMAGQHVLQWDGWDQSKVLSLRDHPKLRFYGSGYRFSQNTILVSWSDMPEQMVPEGSLKPQAVKIRKMLPRPLGLNRHAYHPLAMCRDVDLNLELPNSLKNNEQGLPIVEGVSPWRVTAVPEDKLLIETERSEIVFFLDNQLVYENETSYFPYTWNWTPQGFSGGVHYMTAFIVGFKEHFGFTTVKFQLNDAVGQSQ